jgi:hypothetical protein
VGRKYSVRELDLIRCSGAANPAVNFKKKCAGPLPGSPSAVASCTPVKPAVYLSGIVMLDGRRGIAVRPASLRSERMPTKHGFELRRTGDGDLVIRANDDGRLKAERGCIIVQERDIPALIEMLGRQLEGVCKDLEDSTTIRNLRPAT